MKSAITTKLYCQSCGTRLVWLADSRGVEVKLEPDGNVHGLTLNAVCAGCQSKYTGWLYVGNAPLWWQEERADRSRSTHKRDSLKNYQQASAKRKRRVKAAGAGS